MSTYQKTKEWILICTVIILLCDLKEWYMIVRKPQCKKSVAKGNSQIYNFHIPNAITILLFEHYIGIEDSLCFCGVCWIFIGGDWRWVFCFKMNAGIMNVLIVGGICFLCEVRGCSVIVHWVILMGKDSERKVSIFK